MTEKRRLIVDWRDGRISLPEEMRRIFLVSNHAPPWDIFEDPVLRDLSVYLMWKAAIASHYPNLIICETPTFLEKLSEKKRLPGDASGIWLPALACAFPACFSQVKEIWDKKSTGSAYEIFRWYAENFAKLLPDLELPKWLVEEGNVPGASLAQEYFWHSMSEDFRKAYPLYNGSQLPYLGWLRHNKPGIFRMASDPDALASWLDEPADCDTGEGLTRLMEGVWQNSSEAFSRLPLKEVWGRIGFSSWFARNLYDIYGASKDVLDRLAKKPDSGVRTELPLIVAGMFFCDHASIEEYDNLSPHGLLWFLGFYLQNAVNNPELINLFHKMDLDPHKLGAGNPDFVKLGAGLVQQALWEVDHGLMETQAQAEAATRFFIENYRETPLFTLATASQLDAWGLSGAPDAKKEAETPLVTLLGVPDRPSGIGEDCRVTERMLAGRNISHQTISIAEFLYGKSKGSIVAEKDHPAGQTLIVCLAAQDIYRLWLGTPQSWWNGRHVIGLCPWELGKWPAEANFAVEMLDEIWAPSKFCAAAFASCGKPVVHMPHAVIPPQPNGDLRNELGIKPSTRVFLASFDAGSSLARKNPFAVAQAFKAAFHKNDDVLLILKTMNTGGFSKEMSALLNGIADSHQILLIDECYAPEKNAALLNTCDAFISLHRSEGFGRLLAEAMSLGKLLIASDYGGSSDFARPDTACLVQGKLVSVREKEYLLARDQAWFDADPGHAAHWMRSFYERPEQFDGIRSAGCKYILQNHSLAAVGERMVSALKKLLR